MRIPPITLAANDASLGNELHAYLQKIGGPTSTLCSLASTLEYQKADGEGILVLAANSSGDRQIISALIQDIFRCKKNGTVIILETEAVPPQGADKGSDAPEVRRFRWPEDAPHLSAFLGVWYRNRGGEILPEEEGIAEGIRRRVLEFTPALLPLVPHLEVAAAHDVPVLLTGETGTGKTFLARLIHEHSARKAGRFISIPCGALSPALVASELFGHACGAFTGADRAREGRLAAAGKGTLLLDEVDALGLEQQACLLRVVETGEYERVGGNDTRVCAARLIVASNLDLEIAVRSGKFREDLWYRLNGLSIHLPPLRERPQDIALLAPQLARHFAHKIQKAVSDITAEALAALEAFPWPGNIRQLENVVQQAVLRTTGEQLTLEDFPQPLSQAVGNGTVAVFANSPGFSPPGKGREKKGSDPRGNATLEHVLSIEERALIERILIANNHVRTRAARALGVSRVTLYKKMRKYGLLPRCRPTS